MLLLLLLELLGDDAPVLDRVVHFRRLRERGVVGGERVLVTSGLRERIAAVVLPVGVAAARPLVRRAREIAASELGGAARRRVGGERARALRVAGDERVVRALVATLPQCVPPAVARRRLRGIGRTHRLRRLQQRDADGERQHREPVAAEREQRERQQCEQQPVAVVGAPHALLADAAFLRLRLRIEHAERAQVGIVDAQHRLPAAAAGRCRVERRRVEPRELHLPAIVGEETFSGRERRARRRADAEHVHAEAIRVRLCRGIATGIVHVVGDQQDVAGREARAAHARHGAPDRAVGALALIGHHVGVELVDERGHGARVARERRHVVGVAGIRDEAHLAAAPLLQQRADLQPRLRRARRLQVGRAHRGGEVHGDHQRRAHLPERRLLLAQRRTGERDDRDRRAEHEQHGRQARPARAAGVEQVRQQVRVHRARPCAAARGEAAQRERQQRQHEQAPQPVRSQPCEVGQPAHVASLRGASRSSSAAPASASAIASGSG